MNIILSAENVRFLDIIAYPQIEIEEGRTTFICGESGCGKSTLLKLFNASLSPSAGELYYRSMRLESLDSVSLRREVLLAAQTVYLFSGTVEDNFKEFYSYREEPAISREEMKRYLALCQADFGLDASCDTMSGGEKQRVFIAICLSFQPKVFMLDEPTSALDTKTARTFFRSLVAFCKEQSITLLIVSHDRQLATEFADRCLELGTAKQRM